MDTTDPPANRRPRRIRIGLKGLLLGFVVLSLIAGAYRYGYERGRRDGPIIPTSLDFYRIYPREYDVSDLVTPAAGKGANPDDVALLIEHLTTWAAPSTWDIAGGYGTIAADGNSLLVTHSFAGHAAVLEQLSRIRDYWQRARKKDLGLVTHELIESELEAERR